MTNANKVNLKDIDVPALKPTTIPVNPSDPIAIVNNQIISRQQLADECVARKGKEILELLINRTLIEQALRSKKLEVTAAEIDQEIETVAEAVRNQPRGLAADPRQGTRDQSGAVCPGHHLPGPCAAETVRGQGPGHTR